MSSMPTKTTNSTDKHDEHKHLDHLDNLINPKKVIDKKSGKPLIFLGNNLYKTLTKFCTKPDGSRCISKEVLEYIFDLNSLHSILWLPFNGIL
jgi:hypothetical protein